MASSLTTLPLSRLLAIRNQLSPLAQPSQSALDHFPGLRIGMRRGQGLEFDDLRQYLPGDDIRHIDWNVTARTGEPHTRLHREEREHTTTVVVDLRPGMFTGSTILKAVRAGELAAASLWQASRSGDRCAAVVFSAQGIRASRPASAARGVLDACDLIAGEFAEAHKFAATSSANGPADTSRGSGANLETLLDWLSLAGRRAGTTLLFSNFEQPNQEWLLKLKAASRKHRLIAIALLDKLETEGVPAGVYHYQTNGSSQQVILNRQTAIVLRDQLDKSVQELRALFSESHTPLLTLQVEDDNSSLLVMLTARHIL